MSIKPESLKKIESRFLEIAADALTKNLLAPEKARKGARDFLKLYPFQSVEEVKKKVSDFVKTYAEFKQLDTFLEGFEEREKAQDVLNKIEYIIDKKNSS